MNEQLKQIIEHYGVMKQLKYFQSEVFELNEAIINMQNKKREMEGQTPEIVELTLEEYRYHIAEEIADVIVMLAQFKEYYGITDEQIDDVFDYKVARQLERIKNEVDNGN